MTGMNKIAAAFLMLAAGFSAAEARPSSAVTVKAEIDSAQLTMGDRAHLLVTVDMPDAVTSTAQLVDFPVLTPGKEYMEFHGVDVVASDSVSSSSNGSTRINFDFTIQAFDPGTVTIPPFAVVASPGADTAFSTVVALKVLPVDVDSLQTIHPMASVASPQNRWYDYVPDWLFWTLLAVVLVLYRAYRHSAPIPARSLRHKRYGNDVHPDSSRATQQSRNKDDRRRDACRALDCRLREVCQGAAYA